MKKILSIVLMIAMLLTSTAALAEGSMPMFCINVGEIMMETDGETILDLTGLNVSLGAGFDEDEGAVLVSGKATGGEAVALDAGIAMANGKLVVNVDGMTEPLTLDLASVLTEENLQMLVDELMAQFTDEELLALTQMYEAVLEIYSEDSLLAMEEALTGYEARIEEILMENLTAEEGVDHAFLTRDEEETADVVSIAITGENMAELMNMAVSVYDSNPAFLKLINAALMLDGEEPIESFTEVLDEAEMTEAYSAFDVVIDVYDSNENSGELMDIGISIFDATAEEETLLADIWLGIDMVDAVNAILVVNDPESGDSLYADFIVTESEEFPGEMVYTGYAGMIYEDGEQEQLLNLWVGPDADYGTLGSLVIGEEDDAVGIAWGFNDQTQVLNLYDEYGTDITMGITTDFDGAEAGEYKVYMEMIEDGTATSMSAVVSFTVEEAALDDVLAIAAMDGIDMLNITTEDEDQLYGDIEKITLNAMLALAQNVPGIGAMLGIGG